MRIKDKAENSYSLFSRFMFWLQKRKFGMVLPATLLWGRSSWLYLTFSLMYGAISRKNSPLDPSLISLLNTRVAQINQCPFCIDLNASFLQQQNISNEKILELTNFQNSDLYSEKEKAALLFAEAVTRNITDTYDSTVSHLKEYFNDDEVVEITAVIAFENLSSKFNAALGVESQGLCKIPDNEQESQK